MCEIARKSGISCSVGSYLVSCQMFIQIYQTDNSRMKNKINSLILCETKDCCPMCNMIKRSFRQSVAGQALEGTIAKQHKRALLVAQMVKSNTHTHTNDKFQGDQDLKAIIH